jgi:hypothetical protein
MKKSRLLSAFCALILGLFIVSSANAATVWVGSGMVNQINELDFSGNVIGTIAPFTSQRTGGMIMVGNEVWWGSADTNQIFRLDIFGNPIGTIAPFTGTRTGGMTMVGNEVWWGSADTNQIFRLDSSGSVIGSFAGSVIGWTGGMTVVPIPAAVWLFGSGLIGLIGLARRKERI